MLRFQKLIKNLAINTG